MLIKNVFKSLFAFALLLSIQSCVKDELTETVSPDEENLVEEEEESSITDITNLQIPEGFEFETSETVAVTITDNSPNAIYTVYAYNNTQYNIEEVDIVNDDGEADTVVTFESDELNQLLFKGRPVNGVLEHIIMSPSYYSQIYIRRKEGNSFTSEIVDIQNGSADYTFADTSGKMRKTEIASFKHKITQSRFEAKNVEIDTLFAVNGSGQLFSINPLNGSLKELAAMPMGSYTAAIDHANMYLYSIGRSNGYPLMRYDMINNSWTTIANLGMGGPRLAYNENDGLLYFSTKAKVHTIDPSNATVLNTWNINNLNNTNGGDLAFSADGTLFLSSFGGLYRLDLDNNNVYQATRISADNLPFNPTSMTFDSNNELWLAANGSDSDLIIMDTVTGGWEYVYGPNSTSGVSLGRTVNDLTTYTVSEDIEDPDSDGDGITDSDDEYPDDAEKAFETFTPSKYGWGTLAFEDLWPYLGDYDFNDTAVNYRFVAIQNAFNEVVQLDIYFEVTSDGAGLTNALGIELESIAPGQIESVVGTVLTENYINVGGNGTEEGQDRAVIILFDNNETMLNIATEVNVKFTTPLTTAQIGIAPFNAFLIINKDRGREIHLPNRLRTGLGVNTVEVDGVNQDPDGNYQTDTRLPWAINIMHNFKVPQERVPVNQAYNFFNDWATSGGNTYPDWYKDNSGYRNESKLKQ
ncbi:LruC domain-containing protein [Croceitalea rosinachiae]|uniref:LruC domain-containing protein n=1 Tax=Croceitalea rosinachiae TaxID=3075596 RepID=A0ABU3ADN7_9FLAO|nr:LruC domain-containing protein [Croceitalea sp. F388]MDT0608099.1 LruC domain-containing protein [Croceitalea sp. F388]